MSKTSGGDDNRSPKNYPIIADPFGKFQEYPVPIGVASDPELSDGAKLLYGYLRYRYGLAKKDRKQKCSVKAETIADDLGSNEKTVERWLSKLRAEGYITTIRHGREAAEHLFMAHPRLKDSLRKEWRAANPSFVRDHWPSSNPSDLGDQHKPSEMRDQNPNPSVVGAPIPHFCPSNPSNLRNAYKKEEELKKSLKKNSSSSSSSVPVPSAADEDEEACAPLQRTEQDIMSMAVALADMLPGKPLPRNELVLEVLSQAPTWSVAQIKEALRINASEKPSRPQGYSWFVRVVADIFSRWKGKPPELRTEYVPGPRIVQHEPELTEEQIAEIEADRERTAEATARFTELLQTLAEPVRKEIQYWHLFSWWAEDQRAAVSRYLRETPPSTVCKKCHCFGFQFTASGPWPCSACRLSNPVPEFQPTEGNACR